MYFLLNSMKRFHLFEFEDQQWFPANIRNYMTDYLQFVATKADPYKSIIPLLKKGLQKCSTNTIIDLASGGGGGWSNITPKLQKEVPDLKVILTDFFPNILAFKETVKQNEDVFTYETDAVNALDVPEKLKGFRTQFLSFHHFKPEQAKQILQNAVDTGSGIAIFEAQERSISTFLQFSFVPIAVLLLTPFIRPFKLGRIIFTYLIPLMPLAIWWDGVISVLRTYKLEEMKEMTQALINAENYEWKIEKIDQKPMPVLYLMGYPKDD